MFFNLLISMKPYISRFGRVVLTLSLIATVSYAQPSSIGGGSMNAVQSLRQAQQAADDAYANQKYKTAYQRYMKLAEVGDKFAQFRLAVMYENGQHIEQDIISAYAWSYLAAENQRKEFMNYHASIRAKLNPIQLEQGRLLAGDLIKKYGLYRQSVEAEKLLMKTLRTCTGSRVGNTCDAVEVLDLTCNIQSDRIPSPSCLRIGTMGLQAIVGSFPLQIKHVRQNLLDFMSRYNPGRVELGDFELIDKPVSAEPDQQPDTDNSDDDND